MQKSPPFLPTGLLKRSSSVAVLTGAGVSAESGIPTFRSNGGFWQQHRFEDLATPQGFARDPKFVWTWYEERRRAIALARPNAGHYALAEMEKRIASFTLITQNVDGCTISPDRGTSSSFTEISGFCAASNAARNTKIALS
jgi:NAD-dependent deacetylase